MKLIKYKILLPILAAAIVGLIFGISISSLGVIILFGEIVAVEIIGLIVKYIEERREYKRKLRRKTDLLLKRHL
jgi:hypothetical protein